MATSSYLGDIDAILQKGKCAPMRFAQTTPVVTYYSIHIQETRHLPTMTPTIALHLPRTRSITDSSSISFWRCFVM